MRSQRSILLLLMALCMVLPLSAQTLDRISGRVVDEEGDALPQVMVLLLDREESPLVYCTTETDGTFAATVPASAGARAVSISFRLLGLQTVTLSLDKWSTGQTVVMREAPIELHEVRVQARPVHRAGDTLTYIAAGFRQKQDRTLSDVLAKMPGLEVLPTGMIKYQGKSINKFYIEGLDLLGGAYAQASENLDAKKVKSVQVLTNHQPIQALKNIAFSDQAALNIVLTDDAKSVWQGVADVAAGSVAQDRGHFLRDARLMGMLFAHRSQNLTLLKSNDVGKDIRFEILDLAHRDETVSGPVPLLSPIELSVSGPDRSRYWHNDSHLFTANQLFRTAHGNDLRVRLHAMYDLSRVRQREETRYLLWTDRPEVDQELEAANRTVECQAEVKYEANKSDFFLSSTLTGHIDLLRSLGETVVNDAPCSPEVHSRNDWVGHYLKFVRALGKDRFTLVSKTTLSRTPGRLLLLDGGTEQLSMDAADWSLSASLHHPFGWVQSEWSAGITTADRRLHQDLGDDPREDRCRMWKAYLSPAFRAEGLDWKGSLSLPAALLRQEAGGAAERVKPLFTPLARVEWTPTEKTRLALTGNYLVTPRSFASVTAVPLYRSYLLLTEGTGRAGLSRSLSASALVKYDDPMHTLFAHLQVSLMDHRGDPLYRTALEGPVYRRIATDRTGRSDLLSLQGRVSKGFGWGLFTVALSSDYHRQRYQLLVGSEPKPFVSRVGTLHLEAYYHPLQSLSLELDSSGTLSGVTPPDGAAGTRYLSFYHTLKVYYMPGRWEAKWESELFHSPDKSVSRSFFTDLSLTYRTDSWEAGLECRNLAGTTSYLSRHFGTEAEYATRTLLRPRELLLRLSFSL